MRVLKIFDGDYPWDVRVEKVAETLLDAGHEVLLVCRNSKGLPRDETLPSGLKIARVPALGALTFPLFLNPLWIWTAWSAARRFSPDLVLARDLVLAPLAIAIAWLQRTPVVADLAEPYPDSLRSNFQFQKRGRADWLIRNPDIADLVERFVVRRIDQAVVVCPEAGERLVARGLPGDRWTEVTNTARLDRFVVRSRSRPAQLEGLEDRFVLLFSGLLAGDRGLDTLLHAFSELEQHEPGRFALLVVGEGPVRAELEAQAARLGLGASIRFAGWVEYLELPDIIAQCDLGLLPFHSCPHINASMANKMFEYMTHSLPVVVSDVVPMLRVLKDANCGLSFPSGDVRALADAIRELADSPERLAEMGASARAAVLARYNWEWDAKKLLRTIARAAGESGAGPED